MNEVINPVKMMLGLMNDDSVNTMLEIIQTFLDELFKIQGATFNYTGSEFCAGVLYGIHGARIIIQVGHKMVTMMEKA